MCTTFADSALNLHSAQEISDGMEIWAGRRITL